MMVDLESEDEEIVVLRERHQNFKTQQTEQQVSKENHNNNNRMAKILRDTNRSPLRDINAVFMARPLFRLSATSKSLKSISRKSFTNDNYSHNKVVINSSIVSRATPIKPKQPPPNLVVKRMQEKDQLRRDNLSKRTQFFLAKEILQNKAKPEINAKSRLITKSRKNQIVLDTCSNHEKRKVPTIVTEKQQLNPKHSSNTRNQQFMKSQQDWAQHRDAHLLRQRLELKERELDQCASHHKPPPRSTHQKSRTRTLETDDEGSLMMSRVVVVSQFSRK